jgi:DNA-binding NarL/FixJ family response regulator
VNPIRILIVDDHTLVRAGLRALLENIEGLEVVGEASDGHEALAWVEHDRPHVILMDVMMPGLNGLEATARIAREWKNVRVLVLSMNANEEYVLQAMRAGAAGYLLKNVSTAEFELAIKAVARGETYLSSAVSKHVIEAYIQRVGGEPSPLERLSPRQREVLQLIAEGNTTKEIAIRLNLSVKTVEMHRSHLMDQLDIHDVAGLVRFAIRTGLVSANS